MSDDSKKSKNYPVGYKKTPVHSRWRKGQSGNPLGRPKKAAVDQVLHFTMNNFRDIMMIAALHPVTVRENGVETTVPTLTAIMKSLGLKSAGGNIQATKTFLNYFVRAATDSDELKLEWHLQWTDLLNKRELASRNPGSLEHYQLSYQYFMTKKQFRRVEGIEKWLFEDDEPITKKDWFVFMECYEMAKKGENAPYPPPYPSNNEEQDLQNKSDLDRNFRQVDEFFFHQIVERLSRRRQDTYYGPFTDEEWEDFKKYHIDTQTAKNPDYIPPTDEEWVELRRALDAEDAAKAPK